MSVNMKVLPCPFCGSKMIDPCVSQGDFVAAGCLDCGASGPMIRKDEKGVVRHEMCAIKAWNRRGKDATP